MPTALSLLNRELSRLDYLGRILEKAREASVPVVERLRYLTYCSRNLDEFFMVRVGATRDLLDAGISERSPDGLLPAEQMAAMRQRTRELLDAMYHCLNDELLPELGARGIVVTGFESLSEDERIPLTKYFHEAVAPVLTPLAIDPGHPFPFVTNLALNIAVTVQSGRGEHAVLFKIPASLPRFIRSLDQRFVPIESLIIAHLESFFPALQVRGALVFRAIRNSELSIDRDEVENLRESVEAELRRRERKQVICLEIDRRADESVVRLLTDGMKARAEDVYRVAGFPQIRDLAVVADGVEAAEPLTYREFNPRLPQRLASSADIFSIIRERDVLLHRPYDSFTAIIELLYAAATDPAVVAIKQTVYQTDEDSPVIDQLVLAALNGKQVTVVIELQARFEEKRNIAMAARLQEAGAQVVYGLVGIQAHAKLCLVVRSEDDRLRHYVHLSTGNYNVDTARAYCDLDLLTANEDFGRDASQLINVLTGFSAASLASGRPQWKHFIVAPFDLRGALLARIEREIKHAKERRSARVTAKVNSLVDPEVIDALYRAAAAGVQIDLAVRAICSLVPGENIRVLSVVDRFLEHSRIVRFENGGNPEVLLSSGDLMPRNFTRRVEVAFPLLDPVVRSHAEQILEITFADRASSWDLQPDGTWKRRQGGVASQQRFIDIARAEAVPLGDYDEAIEQAPKIRRKAKRKR